MTLRECYQLLKLKPGASEQEIRKQYKRLALKLHPDRNPDPKAHEQFIQLSLAVEILLNPSKELPKYPTNGTTTSSKTSRAAKNETDEERLARMKEAQRRFEQQRRRKEAEDHTYFVSLTSGIKWNVFKWVVRLGVVFSVMLLLDGFLPKHYERDRLLAYQVGNHNGIFFSSISAIQLENSGYHFAQNNRYAWTECYPEVYLETSWFLHTPFSMISNDDFDSYITNIDFHIGSIRWYLVLFFLIPLYPYWMKRKKLSFVFFYQFSFWGIGLVELYLLVSDQRWLHILTLGFV